VRRYNHGYSGSSKVPCEKAWYLRAMVGPTYQLGTKRSRWFYCSARRQQRSTNDTLIHGRNIHVDRSFTTYSQTVHSPVIVCLPLAAVLDGSLLAAFCSLPSCRIGCSLGDAETMSKQRLRSQLRSLDREVAEDHEPSRQTTFNTNYVALFDGNFLFLCVFNRATPSAREGIVRGGLPH
jgi:hypothetical protein